MRSKSALTTSKRDKERVTTRTIDVGGMSKSIRDKVDYVVYCVNEFARAHSIPYSRAFDYLDKYQALDYIVNFYVENTQTPMRLMLEDMAECCRTRGGTLV